MKTNLCKHLRSKKMYIPALADELSDETEAHHGQLGHCWCLRTMTEVGPDDKRVGADNCSANRTCFEQ